MTGTRKHPCYPDTARPVLIGDTAHDSRNGRSGVVVSIWSDEVVEVDDSGGVVPVEWLRIGPAPEPDTSLLLTIPVSRADLRDLVRHALAWGDVVPDAGPVARLVLATVAALPADELAAFRAEIEADL